MSKRKKKNYEEPFYMTTFCNFAHSLKTGIPIGHECYIIPPELLKAEMENDNFEETRKIWAPWHSLGNMRKLHRGIKRIAS